MTVNTALSSVAPALTYALGICRGLENHERLEWVFESFSFSARHGRGGVEAVADDETLFVRLPTGVRKTNPSSLSSSSSSSSNKDVNSYTSRR